MGIPAYAIKPISRQYPDRSRTGKLEKGINIFNKGQREAKLLELLGKKVSVAEIAEYFGVSRKTIYNWKQVALDSLLERIPEADIYARVGETISFYKNIQQGVFRSLETAPESQLVKLYKLLLETEAEMHRYLLSVGFYEKITLATN